MEETMTTSQGLLLVMADIDPAIEHDFNQWYEQEHLAERMAMPGFLRARRFKVVEGSPKYLALYDLESPDVLKSANYQPFAVFRDRDARALRRQVDSAA